MWKKDLVYRNTGLGLKNGRTILAVKQILFPLKKIIIFVEKERTTRLNTRYFTNYRKCIAFWGIKRRFS